MTKFGTGTLTGYSLNYPSIALNNVLGTVVVNRSVTNVGATAATCTATASVSGYSRRQPGNAGYASQQHQERKRSHGTIMGTGLDEIKNDSYE